MNKEAARKYTGFYLVAIMVLIVLEIVFGVVIEDFRKSTHFQILTVCFINLVWVAGFAHTIFLPMSENLQDILEKLSKLEEAVGKARRTQ